MINNLLYSADIANNLSLSDSGWLLSLGDITTVDIEY